MKRLFACAAIAAGVSLAASAALPERFIGQYAQLEYLRSTVGGGQYIKTGVLMDGKARVELHIYTYNGFTDWAVPFGARNGNECQFFCCAANAMSGTTIRNDWFRRYGTQATDGGGGPLLTGAPGIVGEHTILMNANNYALDTYPGNSFAAENFSTSYEGYVFAVNENGTASKFMPMDFYSLKIYDKNGVLVRDYLPCKRVSDQKVGLLDVADHSGEPGYEPFYANAGTGDDFTSGPVLAELIVNPIPEPAYDGLHPCCPEVIVRNAEGQVLDPSDYEVRYSDNDVVGVNIAAATVVGLNSYSGLTTSVRFSIAAAPQDRLTISNLTCPDWAGEPVVPTYTVKLDGAPANPATYAAILRNNDAPGVGTLVVTGLTGTACEGLAAVTGFAISGAGLLPEGCVPVEYIEGDGNSAWYETDFVPNPQTDRIIADAAFLDVGRQGTIWCARAEGNKQSYALFNNGTADGNFWFRYGDGKDKRLHPAFSKDERCSFVTAGNKTTYVAGGTTNELTVDYDKNFRAAGGPLSIFALNSYANGEMTGIAAYGLLRLYSLRIYRNHALIHNFLPVKDANGVAQLCDTCEPKAKLVRHETFKAGPVCSRAVAAEPPACAYVGERPYTTSVTARDAATAKPIDNLSDFFDISYSDNTAPGWATMTLTGKAGTPYAGQIDTRYFRIVQAYRVTPDAAGGGEGSWDSPMTFAEAWSAAAANGAEVWLKKGTHALTGSPAAATAVAAAVTVRGGFDGTEDTPEDRTSQDVSTIDGVGQYNGLWFSNEQTVTFEQIRFTGAKDFAIRKTGTGDLTLSKCRISSNTFKGNEGFDGAAATEEVKTFTGWKTDYFGGVLQGSGGGKAYLTAENCVFDGNSLAGSTYTISGGAVGIVNFGKAIFDDCLFTSNSATAGVGGGVCIGAYSTEVELRRCEFRGNRATSDRANVIWLSQVCPLSMNRCLIVGNYLQNASGAGNGVCRMWGDSRAIAHENSIWNSTIAYNAIGGTGAFCVEASMNTIIGDCILFGNVRMGGTGPVDIAYGGSTAVSVQNTLFGGEGTDYIAPESAGQGKMTLTDCVFGDPRFVTKTHDFKRLFGVTTLPVDSAVTATWPGFDKAVALDCHVRRGSPAVDAGGTTRDYSQEPKPNGKRANIGVYGGTSEAAKSNGYGLLLFVQ